jgi:hypothetical protein
MLASGLSIFVLLSVALLGQFRLMQARSRASLQPVRVRSDRARHYR